MTGWGKRADMLVHEADPFNAESAPQVLAGADLTPVEALHSRNHGPVPETLVAWEMDGAPLTRVHGAPARVVVPGYIGARSVKWVQGIEVRDAPSDTYFQATAYRVLPVDADPDAAGPGDGISLGPWSLNCDILVPASVARVEVSIDEGRTWSPARLHDAPSPWSWRRWEAEVDLPAGRSVIMARAWDDSGAQQPSDAAHLWNPKGYANTAWPRVTVDASGG